MLCLADLWRFKVEGTIQNLAFSSNGNLGVASWDNCGYFLDPNGSLLSKVCGSDDMSNISYSNGRFGLVNWDEHVYLTDESGNLIKKIRVGEEYSNAIAMRPNGFVVCQNKCAFFDFNGNKLWDVEIGSTNINPLYYQGYWYVVDVGGWKLLIIKDGSIAKEIRLYGNPSNSAMCGKYLAISYENTVHLYNLNDPKDPKRISIFGPFRGPYSVAFSPKCKYIAVIDMWSNELRIHDIKGSLALKKKYNEDENSFINSLSWWKRRVAVGFSNGKIYMHEVFGPKFTFGAGGGI